ncbi:Uncharacterised protein [Mycobacteroides abscessus]|nr:Uncharacterised protein [Mycobacteroides abscessus]
MSHDAVSGSPGLGAFHSAKSRGSRLAAASSASAGTSSGTGLRSSRRWLVSAPYSGQDRTSNHTSPGPVV